MNGDAGGLTLGLALGAELGVVRQLGPAWGLAIGVTTQYVKSDVNGNTDLVQIGLFVGLRGHPARTRPPPPPRPDPPPRSR